jgi:hypothetical protein
MGMCLCRVFAICTRSSPQRFNDALASASLMVLLVRRILLDRVVELIVDLRHGQRCTGHRRPEL